MAVNEAYTPLPADLPEDWSLGQTVAPAGADVGLSEQHGYNYLMQQVNATQRAVNLQAGEAVGKSLAGQTVEPVPGTEVVAGDGAEIFNDYRERAFNSYGKPAAGNIASGEYAHAEGTRATASGEGAHAEGGITLASGTRSHAEGSATTASGELAHAEGTGTTASGTAAHSEGQDTTAGQMAAHAEGSGTTASQFAAHAEGQNTTASQMVAHAEGLETVSSQVGSHAEGWNTEAKGEASHAGGLYTIANGFQCVVGTYNVEAAGGELSGSRFIVGGGTSQTRKNAFRVEASGKCYGSGAWNTSGADYAELFEWLDGNPAREDRAGLFVTLEGEKLRIASPADSFVLGVVSATPSVVGDVYDDQWAGMYVRDVFGRTVMQMQDFPARTVEVPAADGGRETVEILPARRGPAPKVNPDYDPAVKYQPRTRRPEWDAVGMLGKLVAVDDGTCQVDGWAAVGEGGRATRSEIRSKYRVMARLDKTHVKLLIL